MAQIQVAVLDPTGSRKTTVEVPDNVPLSRLVPALANRMGLPTVDEAGQPIRYRLSFSDSEIAEESTLEAAGVRSDALLRLYAEMRAGCFLRGTRVSMESGASLPIERVQVGARVLSFDVYRQKHCSGIVAEKTMAETPEYLVVNGMLRVTPTHLLYVEKRWLPAGRIAIGSDLLSEDGSPCPIRCIERVAQGTPVYNLRLRNAEHTFFADRILVHNENVKNLWKDVFLERLLKSRTPSDRHDVMMVRLEDDHRQQLINDITDAVEARLIVKIISQMDATSKEREAVRGTILARPVFGLPATDEQFLCDAFMVMPFSSQFQSIYDDYIKPVIESFSLTIRRADDFFTHRNIIEDIWSAIARCQFVIADCTGRNPNVFYELGIAHTLGRPTILLGQAIEDLPFDLQGRRVIVYEDRSGGLKTLQKKLRGAVEAVMTAGGRAT